ncbi:alcohol dehydrogenase catalytic domain-containing protein [Mesorhizobium sp.]|uniref:alcohol dehydrogenase catalytic domain-containing protein n=1 Tax=Mesorhizobium sp. TaxID=1871066 RepID=UPI0007ED5ADB|nr:alcohol dehydrogenase catalytic domain-containing protein [Mesorhizobium sp.]RWB35297.1 MAG: zinc-binding dehydrogenase [Mesorhizobium sp.]RWD46626.1 MAG: zinc-binding dehydrogenase [Mesorhizobium sp.]RWE70153.1 MAG: zinc-binding dehydrogenase [Mesorhizobium sp.]TIT16670.1 MAG: zinc-binding dehydrogenase [Mesorhizobium sp.]TIY12022.1 MAG: zinc-binding dehydrogenase [Mesorhizobium sp.]
MKALRFHAARDLRLDDIDPPADPRPDEVIVQVSHCGICGTDIHEYLDGPVFVSTEPHPLTGASAPLVLGHEFSGRIASVGQSVSRFARGDRVAILPHLNRPGDYFVRRGMGHISDTTALVGLSSAYGGMGEYAVLPQDNVVKLPAEVSDEQGALFEPMAVAINAIDRGGVDAGSTVLVTGAGPIGVLAAMAAKAGGASRVVVSEANPARRHRLESLGLGYEIVDPTSANFGDAVLGPTEEGLGVDVAVECAGNERALADCIRLVRRGGTIVQVGIFVDPPRVNMRLLVSKAVTLTTSWGFPITIGPRVVQMIAAGQVQPEKIITGRVTMADAIAQGFDTLARPDQDHLKVLIAVAA